MKTKLRILPLAFALICIHSCTKESIDTFSPETLQSTGKTLAFTLGQHYGGGIIFYIDSSGQHGLIAAEDDLKSTLFRWYNGDYTITKAKATAIGTGQRNTKKIIESQGTTGSYAALGCSNSKRGGFTDWYLPSKDELNLLYLQRNTVGGFVNDFYWSSSEYPTKYGYLAWRQSFATGIQDSELKYVYYRVRAIRAF